MANKKLLKTYHGIPKTPIDDNTVFYASLDGTTVAEVGGALTLGTGNFKPMPTGLGYKFNGDSNVVVPVNGLSANQGTIDLLVNADDFKNEANDTAMLVSLIGTPGAILYITYIKSSNILYFRERNPDSSVKSTPSFSPNGGMLSVRATWTSTTLSLQVNGKLIGSVARSVVEHDIPNSILLGAYTVGNTSRTKSTLADVSVSNIDRGTYFPTLPQDFIDGNARIVPAFSEQRQAYSDALTSEYKTEIVKASGETKRQYSLTQAVAGAWASGDTVKVKGLAGEIISGVIDSDTALARVVQSTSNSNLIYVDDVSKFIVGDFFRYLWVGSNSTTAELNITAIDATNKIITFNTTINSIAGDLLFESTPSTSSPLVKTSLTGTATAGAATTITLPATFSSVDDAYNGLTIQILSGTGAGQVKTITDYTGSTKLVTVSAWTTNPDNTSVFIISGISVTGTWSNLGTTQATFTLGVTTGLTNQDLSIEYSLNEVAGQGGIPEVLTSVLGGEINAKVVDVSFTKISTDYVGKISGSVVENANIVKASGYGNSPTTSLQIPSSVSWNETNSYSNIKTLDSNLLSLLGKSNDGIQANSVGIIPQQLFSFDLIALVERKYGAIPAISVADKILWLKANIDKITPFWYGFGSCPSGNKAILRFFNNSNTWSSAWDSLKVTSSSPSLITASLASIDIITLNTIDTNGFIHFLAYTDASDGVTASTINTDYISLDVTLNYNARLTLPNVPYSIGSRKLAVNPTVHISDDFAKKVSGSVLENPHTRKNKSNSSLLAPSNSTWVDGVQASYDNIKNLDDIKSSTGATLDLDIPQQLFSFNLIEMVERKFGKIPALDIVGKVAWLKNNLASLTVNWYGYGSCPSGNKSYFTVLMNSVWENGSFIRSHTSSTITKLSINMLSTLISAINTDGFVHFLAYTDMASTTSPTLLMLSGHGLSLGDIVENTTRSLFSKLGTGSGVPTINTLVLGDSVVGQIAGDTINKYHRYSTTATTVVGTTETTVVINNHGLLVGDLITNDGTSSIMRKVLTVVDANTITISQWVGLNASTAIYLYHCTGQQTAEGTSPNQLQLTAHGLGHLDIIENTTRSVSQVIFGPTVNAIPTVNIANQAAGDSIKKYKFTTSIQAETGTTSSTVVSTAHGLVTGDYVRFFFHSNAFSKVTVVDANTFTLNTPIADITALDWVFIHKLSGTQVAEAVVSPSTIYTDYINIELILKTPTGYDVLAPEITRRDDGQSNIILVRKETKEIQTMFGGASNRDGIAVYGDYVPYVGLGDKIVNAKILAVGDAIITTIGTGGATQDTNNLGYNALSTKFPSLLEDYKLGSEMFKADGISVNIDKLTLKPYAVINGSIRLNAAAGLSLAPSSTLATVPIRGVNKRPTLSNGIVSGSTGQHLIKLSIPQTLPVDALILVPMLVTENSNMYLVMLSTKKSNSLDSNGLYFYADKITYDVYNLVNKPIIK